MGKVEATGLVSGKGTRIALAKMAGMQEPAPLTPVDAELRIVRASLWRRSDPYETIVLDSSSADEPERDSIPSDDEPRIVSVILSQEEKEPPTASDDSILVVELAMAPPGWPTRPYIVWEGQWDPIGMLTPVLDALWARGVGRDFIEALVDIQAATDAICRPQDLWLVNGWADYRDIADGVQIRQFKGVASASVAVIWPGDEDNVWNLDAVA